MKSITSKKAARALPFPRLNDNKYTRGVCELVVGSEAFVGAAILAVSAANRMGAGYIRAYVCEEAARILHAVQPSVVTLPAGDYASASHNQDERHPRATVVGCGMRGTQEELRLVVDVLESTDAPVLVDGGGLAALAMPDGMAALKKRFIEGLPTVVTPHGGEALRMLQALHEQRALEQTASHGVLGSARDAKEFAARGTRALVGNSTPQEMALALSRAFGVVCVLKGPDTFIASGDEESDRDVSALYQGTPALAKAGTGDILAGVIGALLAQGVSAYDACVAGAFVHARAGVLASVDLGETCVTAEDVLSHLAPAVSALVRKLQKEGN